MLIIQYNKREGFKCLNTCATHMHATSIFITEVLCLATTYTVKTKATTFTALAYSYHLVCTTWINAKAMPTNNQETTAAI